MRFLKSFSVLIGLALFLFLIWNLDLRESMKVLSHTDLRWFLVALLFAVPEILLKSLRLKSFARKAHSHLSLKEAVLVFLSGQPLASVTPGKLGDVGRIIMIHRFTKMPMPQALGVHAADRLYDLASVLLLAIGGLVSMIVESQEQGSALATFVGMLAGMLLVLILLNPRWMKLVLKPLVMGLLSKKLADQLSHHGKQFYTSLHHLLIPTFRIFGPFTLSFLAWETAILRAYVCAVALGLPLSFGKFALLAPVMIVVELLPISILGFGPREQAMFALFTTTQLTHESLLAFDLLIVMAGPLFVSLIGVPAATQILSYFRKSHDKAKL